MWEAEGYLDADKPWHSLHCLGFHRLPLQLLISCLRQREDGGGLHASLPNSEASYWRSQELRGRLSTGLCADPLGTGERGPAVEAVTYKASEGTPTSERLSWRSRYIPPSSSPGRRPKLMRFQVWHACPRLSAREASCPAQRFSNQDGTESWWGVKMQFLTQVQTLGSAFLGPYLESRV